MCVSVDKTLRDIYVLKYLTVNCYTVASRRLHFNNYSNHAQTKRVVTCQLAYTAYLLHEDLIQSSTPAELFEKNASNSSFLSCL